MERVIIVCGEMKLELTPDALAAVLPDVNDDDARTLILARLDDASAGLAVLLPDWTFDALLDAVAEHERAMFDEEARDG